MRPHQFPINGILDDLENVILHRAVHMNENIGVADKYTFNGR